MFVTLSLTVVFGLSAMVFDMGVIYRDQSALTASTQAAALAGAEAMAQPGATSATSQPQSPAIAAQRATRTLPLLFPALR